MTPAKLIVVRGRGAFPHDMLRYDGLEVLVGDLSEDDEFPERDVILQKRNPPYRWYPTDARWKSFGWIVMPRDYNPTQGGGK